MSLLHRLFGSSDTTPPGFDGVVKATGATTHGQGGVEALYSHLGLVESGHHEDAGVLVPEPDNPADPNAVAVTVRGWKIGYLPGYIAQAIEVPAGGSACEVQLFAKPHNGALRAVAFVRTSGDAGWDYSASSWPPITPSEARDEASDMGKATTQRLLADPYRAKETALGMVTADLHFTDTTHIIDDLKREGRLEEALEWCYRAIEATERAHPDDPPPGYTSRTAIIHRKLGQLDRELEVLERYLSRYPRETWDDRGIGERRQKVLALIEKRAS